MSMFMPASTNKWGFPQYGASAKPTFGGGGTGNDGFDLSFGGAVPSVSGTGMPSGPVYSSANNPVLANASLGGGTGSDLKLGTKLGANLGTANLALSGLQTIGGLYASLKQLSLAKKQFAFQRDFANANFANQLKSYNTALSDRSRSRGFTEGQTAEQISSYVSQNQLTDTRPSANKKKKGN